MHFHMPHFRSSQKMLIRAIVAILVAVLLAIFLLVAMAVLLAFPKMAWSMEGVTPFSHQMYLAQIKNADIRLE